MRRLDDLLVAANRNGLRIGKRRLKFAGQFVHSHKQQPLR
jgi:hypothetical protein